MSPSPLPPDPTQPLSPAQQSHSHPVPQLALQEALSHLHLDVLKELERFRLWQRLQRMDSVPPPRAGQLGNTSSVQRPSPVLIQEVVEDLEEEEMPRPSGAFSPLWVLLLWVLSCAGIGFGVRWLIWPEELSLPQSAASRAEEGIPAQVDLAQLPLIPLEPVEGQVGEEFYSGGLDPDRLALGLTATPDLKDVQVDPLQGVPNLLDSLQTDLALASKEPSPPQLANGGAVGSQPGAPVPTFIAYFCGIPERGAPKRQQRRLSGAEPRRGNLLGAHYLLRGRELGTCSRSF